MSNFKAYEVWRLNMRVIRVNWSRIQLFSFIPLCPWDSPHLESWICCAEVFWIGLGPLRRSVRTFGQDSATQTLWNKLRSTCSSSATRAGTQWSRDFAFSRRRTCHPWEPTWQRDHLRLRPPWPRSISNSRFHCGCGRFPSLHCWGRDSHSVLETFS